MSQSRDEIAEQVVALAGSVSSEKADKMRALVSEARKAGPLQSTAETHREEIQPLAKGDGGRLRVRLQPGAFAGLHEPAGIHVNYLPKSTIGSDGASLGQSPGGELPVERRATSGPVVSSEERERVLVVVREYVADVVRSMEELLPGVKKLTEEHAELWKRVEALDARASNAGEGASTRTVKCDNCKRPISTFGQHPSGINICRECGGDSERAPSPAGDPGDWTCRCGRHVSWPGLVCAACGHEHPWKPAPSPVPAESAIEQMIDNEQAGLSGETLRHPSGSTSRRERAKRARAELASLRAEVDRLRTALAEKEKACLDVETVVQALRKVLDDKGYDPTACDAALRTALGAKETK